MFTALLHPPRRFAATVCLAMATLFAATACTASNGDGKPAPTGASGAVTITIDDYRFDMPPTVSPGATITVRNIDRVEHSVTSDAVGLFDAEAEPNGTGSFTAPSTPGSFPLYCRYHPNMRATLIVG
ncbi:cupredoxin domain-containing protein [Nocardia asiatica]|uniref:cupredoxin domain-containing protein n=2 Tax=Nocardia TaxID=1817 RepID=UPI0003022FE0|nr:cupredoxin domain-containing protein [Nocardia asiatica]